MQIDELVSRLEADICAEAVGIHEHNVIRQLIADKWEGKRYNVRFLTQLAERLKYPRESLSGEGGYRITIYGEGTPWPKYDNRVWHYLSHGGLLSVAEFETVDVASGRAAVERNEARQKLLEDVDLLKRLALSAAECRRHWDTLESLTDYGCKGHPAGYILRGSLGLRLAK